MKDLCTMNVSSSSRRLSFIILLSLCLVSLSYGQKKARTLAYEGMKAAKDGTFLVVIETQTKSLAAIDQMIEHASTNEIKSKLIEEKQNKQEFRDIYKASAQAAFSKAYNFGNYQLVNDVDLREVRDSLEVNEVPYIILIRRNDVRELGVLNSDNVHIPSPFPQYFDGFAANLGRMYNNGVTNQKDYTDFFVSSIAKLDNSLPLLYLKLEAKANKRAQRKRLKGE